MLVAGAGCASVAQAAARLAGVTKVKVADAAAYAEQGAENLAALLVDVVKTGYVCDAGQIERQDAANGPVLREWHEGQWMSNHNLRVLEAAAKRRIAINSHEPIKDTGLRRTWPNWVSREGARGMEYNAWGAPPNPPDAIGSTPRSYMARLLLSCSTS